MSARLIVRRGEGSAVTHSLKPAITTIGRDDENDIVFDDDRISRRHAQVAREGDRFVLSDLGSRNGTFLNGRRIAGPEALRHGDVLGLPGMTLRFDQADETVPWEPEGTSDDGLRVDTDRAEVWMRGRRVALTAKEFQALAFLYGKAGHLVSKEALAAHVWPEYAGVVGDYNIDQLIFRLRKKLGAEDGERGYVKTLPRLGYRLAV